MAEPKPCPVCGLENVEFTSASPHEDISGRRCLRCGDYEIVGWAVEYVSQLDEQDRMRISVAVRQASALGNPLVLNNDFIDVLVAEPVARRSLLESADTVLLYLADMAPSHFEAFQHSPDHDFTLLGFTNVQGMADAISALVEMGYLIGQGTGITLEGWKRIEELRRHQPDSRKAFVAMWFAEEMEVAWAEGFKPGIFDTEFFEPVRMLDIDHAGKIDNRIIAEIRTSGLLVADFTGHRGGVYYEAGFAAGLDIPVIWCCREDHFDAVHFDTRQYNHIVWTEPSDLREKLKNRILAVVPAATNG